VPLLRATGVSKTFGSSGASVHALTQVDIEIHAGETLGLVGESGSGKTTLARVLLGILQADAGAEVSLDGEPLAGRTHDRSREQIKAVQIVFQNPDSALNRRHTVRRLVGRALSKLAGLGGSARDRRLLELTRSVRLADRYLDLRPGQLSGGLKQRVAIARAFAGDPRLVVCDEPTSALDVSVQAAVLNLLGELQRKERVAYLFISHDLGVIRYLSDRICVLYLGRVLELGSAEAVFSAPHHPYTEALLSAVPTVDGSTGARIRLDGEIPSPANPPTGCVFHTRCPRKVGEICETREPPLIDHEPGHAIRCHIPLAELRTMQGGERPAHPATQPIA
jgi:peptide/nickel transport system ATP-binding protein